VLFLALLGVGYDAYRRLTAPPRGYVVYEGERVERAERPDTAYFLYERRLYMRRRPQPKVINVNRASLRDLVSLPGIGPKLAKRIIEYRERHGPFRRPEDLLEVKGIGPKRLRKIKPYLRF